MDVTTVEDISDNKNCINKTNARPKQNEGTVDTEAADFEAAITATGFGKFNIMLILVILPTAFAQVFETASMSYVLPIAQCDLSLSLEDKGVLNAITFAGMISSGFIWGYICDASGRKKVMVIGYFLDGFFSLLAASSQNFIMLLVAKFFGGFIINGPFSAATSYLSEFHCSEYRARVQLARGIIVSLGNITLPLIAWAVLPQDLNFVLFNYFDVHSWNVFLFICSLAPLASGVLFLFMPESPKFLMSNGRNEEALRVFQMIYRMNEGKPANTYPIKILADETVLTPVKKTSEDSVKQKTKKAVMEGLYKVKPLFCRPLLLKLIHYLFGFGKLIALNVFISVMVMYASAAGVAEMVWINLPRKFHKWLWLPQLFQSINDYEHSHGGTSSSMCDMLESTLGVQINSTSYTCSVNLDNSSVYINAIIVATSTVLCFFLAGTIISLLGKKKVIIIMAIIGGVSASCIYYAQNSETVLVLSSIFLALTGVCGNVLLTITLEIFPTNLRAMATSLHLMTSRIGSIVGNMIFPVLLRIGCAPPFLYIGFLSFGCSLLTMLYPNTENKPLV